MSPGAKHRIGQIAKAAVSIATLGALVVHVDWRSLAPLFARLDPFWVLTALGVFWAAQVVSALRCVYVVHALGGTLDMPTALRAHFVGLWFNQFLPTGLGGDVVKAAILTEPLGAGVAVRACILDRLSGLCFLMLAILATLPLYAALLPRPEMTLALGLLGAGYWAVLFFGMWGASAIRRRGQHRPVVFKATQVLADMKRFSEFKPLVRQFWTSAIVHANGIVSYGMMAAALGVPVDFQHLVLIVPLVFLVALLPVSLAGWGVREAGAVWLFGLIGHDGAEALAISLGFGLLLLLAAVPGFAVLYWPVSPASARTDIPSPPRRGA